MRDNMIHFGNINNSVSNSQKKSPDAQGLITLAVITALVALGIRKVLKDEGQYPDKRISTKEYFENFDFSKLDDDPKYKKKLKDAIREVKLLDKELDDLADLYQKDSEKIERTVTDYDERKSQLETIRKKYLDGEYGPNKISHKELMRQRALASLKLSQIQSSIRNLFGE